MEKILCDKCNLEIKYREDLVVAPFVLPFILKKFHNACYAQREKVALGFLFLGEKPVNTPVYTAVAIISLLIFLVGSLWFLIPRVGSPNIQMGLLIFGTLFLILSLIIWYPRIISYYKYEKRLPKQKEV